MKNEMNLERQNKDPQTIAKEIFDISQSLINIYKTEPLYQYPIDFLQFSHFCEIYYKMLADLAHDPLKSIKLQEDFFREFTGLYFSSMNHFWSTFNKNDNTNTKNNAKANDNINSEISTHLTIPKDDKRFANPLWDENPYFNLLKQSYYLMTDHSLRWLNSFSSIDRKTRLQLHFYVKNFLDYLCPANFISANPEVMQKILETGSENLLNGFKNFLQDLVQNKGRLNISKTNLKNFKVGENLAITAGKIIYQNDLMQLIQYLPTTAEVAQTPILFIPPWINKYYVLDLSPENSMVRWLVDQGFTVYMISWVNPNSRLSGKEFSDYMLEGPIQALDVITETAQCPSVHMVGYCIGGTLLGCTLAYMAKTGDKRAKSSTYFMSLLDFSNPGELGVFIDKPQLDVLDKIMSEKGYLDGRLLDTTFNMLRPNDLVWPYFINHYLLGKPLKPFDLLYWNADSTNLPYRMYSFYLRNMYLHNRLRKPNKISLAGVPIDLSEITLPSFFLASKTDHITLWKSVYAGIKLVSGDVDFVLTESGHVRGVINPPQLKKYSYFVNQHYQQKKPTEWLQGATEHQGSWWPYWKEWLESHDDGAKVPAKDPVKDQIPIIEDAPGSYVLKRL